MINQLIVKYPLDLTGNNPDNKVLNEPHVIPRERARGFAPNAGAFFTSPSKLKIVHKDTNYTLIPRVDYVAVELYERASKAAGQEVCAGIVILNDKLDGEFLVTYQAVGGEFCCNVDVIQRLIEQLDLDNRPVRWGDILGLPNAFNPAPHLHDIDDLYGMEYVVEALERIRAAIVLGDYNDHEEIRQRIENLKKYLLEQDQQIIAQLQTHMDDKQNPHSTTKAQVGLGLVDNFATASQAAAEAGTANNLFMTPLRVAQGIDKLIGVAFRAHLADHNNPHQVTKAQAGLGNVDNYPTATQAQAVAGTANDAFMTPLRTKDSIGEFALKPLNAHIADKSNPHNTTKAQVGLGSVDDFATATQAQAEAGTANNLFMTPLRVAQAITKQAGELLQAHINDKANPHNTTKAQVGLGLVDNFATASQAEAEAGTANNLFMTPLRVAQAITTQAGTMLQNHINDKNNPHATTKAQVGLSQVENYRIATEAEAIAGGVNTAYMTPYLVMRSITTQLANYVPRNWVSGGGGWSGVIGKIPTVQTNGVLEVGKYIDFHDSGQEVDFNIRYEVRWGGRGWEIYNNGYYNCQDIYIRSDIRDKTKIRKIENGRGIVRMLNGYYYHLHNEEFETAGLIAQELLKIFPQAVMLSTNEDGEERYVIKPSAVEGMLVQAAKEMDAALLEQESKILELEKSNVAMEDSIKALTKRLEALEGK